MLKYAGTIDGQPFLGFMLSRGNVDRLIDGHAILIIGAEMGRPELGQILIDFAETEAEGYALMKASGRIRTDTVIREAVEHQGGGNGVS